MRDERERKRTQRKKGREKTGKEEVCLNSASGLGSSRNPLFTASHVENRERKARNKEKGTRRRRGAAKRPWQKPKRLSSR